MSKITILENKKLRLINVLSKELRNIQIEEINNEIQSFINYLDISQIETKGPLITKNLGTQILNNGDISFDYDIMIQTIRKQTDHGLYKFHNQIVVGNCLYAHFEGRADELSFAQGKINIHIWENDYVDLGEEYTVHLHSDEEWMEVDIFKPVER